MAQVCLAIAAFVSVTFGGGAIADDRNEKAFVDSVPETMLAEVMALKPSHQLNYLRSSKPPIENYIWSEFSYNKTDGDTSSGYGEFYVLWDEHTGRVLWSLDWLGDFQPHSISWPDLNKDGRRDLYLFAGYEDVFSTYAYISQPGNGDYDKNRFKRIYVNENDYSVLLDIDHDGHPEILDSGHQGDTHTDNVCSRSPWKMPEVPESVSSALAEEYVKTVGEFGLNHFTYNMPGLYQSISIGIFDPIRIMQIDHDNLIDVTSKFQKHLNWRLERLEEIRAHNSGDCLPVIDKAISYLKRLTVR